VLCQLSYAPGFGQRIVSAGFGHPSLMTDTPLEDVDREQRERESEQDDLLEQQEEKGYGEDEGEREDALRAE
jgi:hypothetical protein